MALSIDIAANTRQAQAQLTDLSKNFDKVADSLDDLAREASTSGRATDKVGDSLDDLGADAKSAGDKLERTFSDMVGDAKKADAAVSDVGTSARRAGDDGATGMRKLGDAGAEASGELKQNLGETFSSFRGDLEDLPQIAQDVFGGMAGSVGGLLPALGLAAGAAGIGLLIQAFNTAGEESDEFKARAAELGQAYIDATGEAAPAIEDIADAIKEMATATEEGATSLQDLRDVADKSGNSYEDLAKAMAGSTEQLDEMIRSGEERLKQLQDEGSQYDQNNDKQERSYALVMDQVDGQGQYNQYLRDAKAAAEEAAQAEENWRAAGGEELQVKAQLVETISDAYDGVRNSAIDAATSEEGVFDVSKWAEHVANTKVQVEQYQANLQGLKLTPDQWANLMEMPESARTAVVASLAQGPEEAKGKIIAALTDAGSSAADGAQVSFQEGFDPKADVDVKVDTGPSEAKLKALTADRTMKIRVDLDTSAVDNWTPPRKTGTVRVGVDGSAWDRYTPATKIAFVRSQPLGG